MNKTEQPLTFNFIQILLSIKMPIVNILTHNKIKNSKSELNIFKCTKYFENVCYTFKN